MTTREQAIRALRKKLKADALEALTLDAANYARQVASRLDAILAMPDEGLPWVSVEERMPTEADADGTGLVLWADEDDWVEGRPDDLTAKENATHWARRTAIPLPEGERT